MDEMQEVYPRLTDSCMLFGQASLAFDSGARMGSVILCRAALESALYTLSYTKRKGLMSWQLIEPRRNKKGEYVNVRLSELLESIKDRVTPDEFCRIDRIKDDGDFVAHIADRLNKEKFQVEKVEEIRLWLSDAEALTDLKDTAALLHALGRIASKEPYVDESNLDPFA